MSDTTITFTPEAMRNIRNMRHRVNEISMYYGVDSPQSERASSSFAHSLVSMLELGGRITAEDDLGLYGVNDYIHYGVVFHAERTPIDGAPVCGEWSVHS